MFVLKGWGMALSEKDLIYKYVWQCAYRRRYNAKIKGDWDLYDREHETVLMCLGIAKWMEYDSEKPHYLKNSN